jgi:hypothetical protein
MKIEEFLENRKLNTYIQLGGFNYLLDKWESIVERIPFNERCQHDDYKHYVSTRKTIQDIIDNCEVDHISLNRILEADEKFKNKTIKVNYLFLRNIYNDNPVKQWFFFRVPPERIPNWYPMKSKEMEIYSNWKKEMENLTASDKESKKVRHPQ